MRNYFQRRRQVKYLRQLLREARHARNMREDIASPQVLERLRAAQAQSARVLATSAWLELAPATGELEQAIIQLRPPRPWNAWRENIEIILVALAVAMAFRTYFIQPFKIPTASMAPTLHGIHYLPQARATLYDRLPFNLIKWFIFGEWRVEVRAQSFGRLSIEAGPQESRLMIVAGAYHVVPKGMYEHVRDGQMVVRGQLLASGTRVSGDHIFVNKVIWNFRQPQRGEIMVFKTSAIEHPQIKVNEHYVKRLVGLPGETLQIQPPYLLVDGQRAADAPGIIRLSSQQDGYAGFQLGGRDFRPGDYLAAVSNRIALGAEQYFACGDNQFNSLDSRYWGPVPRVNLMGPAVFVYWPISRHWGPIR